MNCTIAHPNPTDTSTNSSWLSAPTTSTDVGSAARRHASRYPEPDDHAPSLLTYLNAGCRSAANGTAAVSRRCGQLDGSPTIPTSRTPSPRPRQSAQSRTRTRINPGQSASRLPRELLTLGRSNRAASFPDLEKRGSGSPHRLGGRLDGSSFERRFATAWDEAAAPFDGPMTRDRTGRPFGPRWTRRGLVEPAARWEPDGIERRNSAGPRPVGRLRLRAGIRRRAYAPGSSESGPVGSAMAARRRGPLFARQSVAAGAGSCGATIRSRWTPCPPPPAG